MSPGDSIPPGDFDDQPPTNPAGMEQGVALALIAGDVRDLARAQAARHERWAAVWELAKVVLGSKVAAPGWVLLCASAALVALSLAGVDVDLTDVVTESAHAWSGEPHDCPPCPECSAPWPSPSPAPLPL